MKHLPIPTTLIYDGTEVRHISSAKDKRHPARQLYISQHGDGYSLSGRGLGPITPFVCRTKERLLSGESRWTKLMQFKDFRIYVHRAVWMAWNELGLNQIPKDYEIHHLNGIETDNCYDNLVCLTRGEHKVWDHHMHILRAKLGNLKALPYANLRSLQAMPTIELQYYLDHIKQVDPEAQMNYEITHHVEFLEH